jgi:hypothetical protein
MSFAILFIAFQISGIKVGPQSFCHEYHLRDKSTAILETMPKSSVELVKIFENDSLLIEVETSDAPELAKYSDSANGSLFSSLPINSYKSNDFSVTKLIVNLLENHKLLIFNRRSGSFLKQIIRIKYTDHYCPSGTIYWEKYLLDDLLLIDMSEAKSS